jgi:hypothetical protein
MFAIQCAQAARQIFWLATLLRLVFDTAALRGSVEMHLPDSTPNHLLDAPSSKIQNRLLRLTADSPEKGVKKGSNYSPDIIDHVPFPVL